MEKVYIQDVELRLKRTDGHAYSYRPLRVEHALVLNAPKFVPIKTVMEKATALVEEYKKENRYNALYDGGYMVLFGEKIPLCTYDAKECSIAMTNGKIYLGLVNGKIGYHARKTIIGFYKRRLYELLKQRVPVIENYVGIKCKSWKINTMFSAWGHCNLTTHELTFSVNLATFPLECIDMVIVHELGHIPYKDHGTDFHLYMDRFIPNHKFLRAKMGDI